MYESYKLSDYRKFDKSNSIDIWKYPHESLCFKFHQNFPSFSLLLLDSPLKNPSLHLYPYVTYIRNTVRWQSKYFHAIRQMHAKIRVTAARKTFLAPGIALDDDPRAGKEFSPREGDGRFHDFASSIFHLASS